jgi:hypothetical protein
MDIILDHPDEAIRLGTLAQAGMVPISIVMKEEGTDMHMNVVGEAG